MTKWEKYFQLLGITDSETKIYLAVLKSGPDTVQNIAKAVGLSRVTVYAAIEALTKHGLMTSVEKGKKQFYAAEPPERIVTLAENKTSQMQTIIKEIKENIQDLKLVQSGDKPVVKMYEGIEAFAAIQDDVIKSKSEELCEFGNIDEINRVYPYGYEHQKHYYDQLAKMKTNRKLIFISKEKKPHSIETNKTIKYLPDNIKFYGDIFFYGDKVWLSNFKDRQVTVMIQSREIRETIQSMFDMIWEQL